MQVIFFREGFKQMQLFRKKKAKEESDNGYE